MKIFVSSTPEDLYKYRKATIAAIRKLKLRPINMDNTDSQLDAIQKADVFIKIYSSSSSSTETTEPSLTEQEYEEANKYNIHCLSYDIDETYEPKKLFKTIGGDLSNWRKRQSIKTAESSPKKHPHQYMNRREELIGH